MLDEAYFCEKDFEVRKSAQKVDELAPSRPSPALERVLSVPKTFLLMTLLQWVMFSSTTAASTARSVARIWRESQSLWITRIGFTALRIIQGETGFTLLMIIQGETESDALGIIQGEKGFTALRIIQGSLH